jgi:dTMP kinase
MQRRDAPVGDVGGISSEDLDDLLKDGKAEGAMVPPGKLVVLEGIDGTGKSHVASRVVSHLEAREVSAIATSEPTDGAVGRLLKKALGIGIDPYTELFLFLSDRADHVRWMRDRLRDGNWLVCDRYAMSSAAYQGTYMEHEWETKGRDPTAWIMGLHHNWWLVPDITVLIIDDVGRCLERVKDRGMTSKYERHEYLERVQKNYLRLAEVNENVVVLDDPDLETLVQAVLGRVEALLGNHR